MGIQSGSKRILDFYRRPTPVESVQSAVTTLSKFSPRYHIPPAYDLIVDNPIETRQDVIDTLELIYRMGRPFHLNIFSLRVIPNTQLAAEVEKEGIDVESISANYFGVAPHMANVLLYLIAMWRPPRRVFDFLLKGVEGFATEQRRYPMLIVMARLLFLLKRSFNYLRFMDFSTMYGTVPYVFWRSGLLSLKQEHFRTRMQHPAARAAAADR